MDTKVLLEDIKTYIKITNNQNYKERLLEAYNLLNENSIENFEEFNDSKLGIGAFTYNEITIFDRLKDEKYNSILSSYVLELSSLSNLPKDLGDRLASWGTIGNTPYRDTYIKEGFLTTGLTEEEKNKYYR